MPSFLAPAQEIPSRKAELAGPVKISDHESQPALKRLVSVHEFLTAGQADEAVETLREVMERYADQMLRLPSGRYVTVRDYCQLQICNWQATAPAALTLYRQRVDPLAKRWYEEGLAQRDEARLQRVADQLLCSSWGDNALFALGEMKLRAGQYTAARDCWERISLLLRTADGRPLWLDVRGHDLDAEWESIAPRLTERTDPPAWLACSETDLDLADVRARLVLTSILEGSLDRATVELAVLRKLSPESQGVLGGRTGNYVERLGELLAAAPQWPLTQPTTDWPTFAGDSTRNVPAAREVRIAGAGWKTPIALDGPLHPETPQPRSRVGEGADGLLSFHPIVVGRLLLLNGPLGVRAFDLRSGEPAWSPAPLADDRDGMALGRFFAEERPQLGMSRVGHATLGVARYTMTALDGRLLVRVGDPVTSWTSDGFRESRVNYLACFDLEASGALLWKSYPGADGPDQNPDSARWAFEGAPVCDGPNVYIALRRSERPPQAYVACLDAQTGKQRWRRLICEAERNIPAEVSEITHNLLTLAEDTLYYNTNLGAVAALRTYDGAVRWISTYDRQTSGEPGEQAAYRDRDLNPCIFYRGMLFVAPRESRSILALDALTGATLWTTDLPRDVMHLLGVCGDTLIASGRRLWWIDIHTGKPQRWPEGELTGVQAYGRGAIAGNEIYWPVRNHTETQDQLLVFDAQVPRQTREPIALNQFGATAGNLVIVDGYLLIAGSDRLFALSQFARKPDEPEPTITQHVTPSERERLPSAALQSNVKQSGPAPLVAKLPASITTPAEPPLPPAAASPP